MGRTETQSPPLGRTLRGSRTRELYFFTLFRTFEAALLALLVFSPVTSRVFELRLPRLATTTTVCFLLVSVGLLFAARQWPAKARAQVTLGVVLDILAVLLAKLATEGAETGIGLLLLVNLGAAALLLPLRVGLSVAIVAGLGTIAEFLLTSVNYVEPDRQLVEPIMFAVTYLATTVLCNLLGRQLEESTALAARRGEEVANLSQLNELIIRRMRSGVIVVDGDLQIRLINESAWHLIGEPSTKERRLETTSAELAQRLARWRLDGVQETLPVVLAPDRPAVIPRMTKLTVIDELFLIFLDDSSLVSRRAEELTLSTLGRLSASIAHEIRNPLAAIHHSAQLLEESEALTGTDRRLVEIVLNHCRRMNGIVENVLALSRRERSRPEQIDLALWVLRFADEYKSGHFLEHDELRAVAQQRNLYAMVDPQQLHQVLCTLVQNALTYGRLPGQAARVTLIARQAGETGVPLLEVIDRGPGIPDSVVARIFEPFFTTSEMGSGLGLYIARQLAEVNQAGLEHVHVAGGGSCFRITLARPRGLDATHGDPHSNRHHAAPLV